MAHKALAKAATDLIHGSGATAEAVRASEILFGGDFKGISETTFNEIADEGNRKIKTRRRRFTPRGIARPLRFVSIKRSGVKRH